jgi:hypothetical protein
MNITAETATRTYTVVYARGAAHLQGLDEVPRDFGHEDAPAYTLSACSALSKNPHFWCEYWTGTDLAEALVQLEACGRYVARSHCKKCHKTATAQIPAAAPAEPSYEEKFLAAFDL